MATLTRYTCTSTSVRVCVAVFVMLNKCNGQRQATPRHNQKPYDIIIMITIKKQKCYILTELYFTALLIMNTNFIDAITFERDECVLFKLNSAKNQCQNNVFFLLIARQSSSSEIYFPMPILAAHVHEIRTAVHAWQTGIQSGIHTPVEC